MSWPVYITALQHGQRGLCELRPHVYFGSREPDSVENMSIAPEVQEHIQRQIREDRDTKRSLLEVVRLPTLCPFRAFSCDMHDIERQ